MIIIFPFCFGFSLYFFPSSNEEKYTTTIIMRESAEEKERNLWGLLKREGLFRFVRWAGSLELGCLWPYSLSHWRGPLARLTHKYKYGYSRWPFGSQVSSRRVVFDIASRLASNNSRFKSTAITDWTPQCSCRACASIYCISSLCERVLHCIALIIETGEQSEFIEGILCAPWRIEVRQLWDPLGESLRILEVRKWKLWSVAFPFDVHFGIDFVLFFVFLGPFLYLRIWNASKVSTAFWDAAFVMHFNLFLVSKCLFWCNAALLAAIQ
jgi:hypothetical protein